MIRVYSQSLGCPKNLVDTERLLGSIGPLEMVSQPEGADLVFINTCAFIAPAVQESVRTVVQMAEDLRDLDHRPILAVGGCLVGRYGQRELAGELPEVDVWLTSNEIDLWPGKVSRALDLPGTGPGRLLSTGPSYAWLKIGEGCRHKCSFCTIPSIRGRNYSSPADELEREARALLEQGVKEIVLVAQDVTNWGAEHGQDLRPLLDRLLPLDGLLRLRLMYLYPAGLTDDLLGYLAKAGPAFAPYFDVPLQHSHPDILGRMGRAFALDSQKVLDRIRRHFDAPAIRTTMMVGFPGETEAHFQDLMRFVAHNRFHHLGVFAYQPEEGTISATLADQLPEHIREERKAALLTMQNGISEEIMSACLGQTMSILVDAPHEEWPGLYIGRSWFQAPDVDGITYVSGPGARAGAMVRAEIVDFTEYDLTALSDEI